MITLLHRRLSTGTAIQIEFTNVILMLDNIREAENKINLIYKEENFLSCYSFSVVVFLVLKSSLFLNSSIVIAIYWFVGFLQKSALRSSYLL